MGLDDIEGVSKGSSSGSSKKKSPEDDDSKIVIGGDPYKKVFDKEYWENEVKPVIREEFGMNVNLVLNKPAERRYEIIHEAATWSPDNKSDEQEELESDRRCKVCGIAADNTSVVLDAKDSNGEIQRVRSCVHHPVAKVAKELGHTFNNE